PGAAGLDLAGDRRGRGPDRTVRARARVRHAAPRRPPHPGPRRRAERVLRGRAVDRVPAHRRGLRSPDGARVWRRRADPRLPMGRAVGTRAVRRRRGPVRDQPADLRRRHVLADAARVFHRHHGHRSRLAGSVRPAGATRARESPVHVPVRLERERHRDLLHALARGRLGRRHLRLPFAAIARRPLRHRRGNRGDGIALALREGPRDPSLAGAHCASDCKAGARAASSADGRGLTGHGAFDDGSSSVGCCSRPVARAVGGGGSCQSPEGGVRMYGNPVRIRRSAGLALTLTVATLLGFATPVAASPATNAEVSVGSPHDVAPRSHQNEPVVAMDAHNPNVLVAGSNDYIDQQACPEDIATGIARCDDFSAGIGVTGVYFSFDRGKTWIQPTYTGWQARNCGTATVCPGSFAPIGRIPWYYEAGLIDDGDPAIAIGPRLENGTFSWSNGSRVYYANLTANFPG